MTHPIERASVEQADREAAANIMIGEGARNGFMDDHPWVQAFARHRQQARDAGFAEGVERAAEVIRARRKEWFCAGDDCSEYDLGRDEGFDLALVAISQALSVEGRCDDDGGSR